MLVPYWIIKSSTIKLVCSKKFSIVLLVITLWVCVPLISERFWSTFVNFFFVRRERKKLSPTNKDHSLRRPLEALKIDLEKIIRHNQRVYTVSSHLCKDIHTSILFTKNMFQNKISILLHVIFYNLHHISIMVISMSSHSHKLDHIKGIKVTSDFLKPTCQHNLMSIKRAWISACNIFDQPILPQKTMIVCFFINNNLKKDKW